MSAKLAKQFSTGVQLELSNPRFTPQHQSGLAGLAYTLSRLEQQDFLSWEIGQTSIALNWTDGKQALDWLWSQTFRIDSDGILRLPGWEQLPLVTRLDLHNVLTGSALKIPKQGFADKSKGKDGFVKLTLEDDAERQRSRSYKALDNFAHQKLITQDVLDGKFSTVTSGVLLGGENRHSGSSGNFGSIEVNLSETIALAFSFVTAGYYSRQIWTKELDKKADEGKRKRSYFDHTIVLPIVTDLVKFTQQYDHVRSLLNQKLNVASLEDGAFQLAKQLHKVAKRLDVSHYHAFRFGQVAWNGNFNPVDKVCLIRVNDTQVNLYRQFDSIVPAAFYLRELIAQNIIAQRPWYQGFSKYATAENRKYFLYSQETKATMQNLKPTLDPTSAAIIDCLLEAYKGYFGKVSANKARRLDYAKERESIRSQINRCRTSAHFRAWWGRMVTTSKFANSILQDPELRSQVTAIAHSPTQWTLARDLAYVALAAYKGKGSDSKEETEDSEDFGD